MRKVLLPFLLLFTIFTLVQSLDNNLKQTLLETTNYGPIEIMLRKIQLFDTNCPPEQSKTYCSGNQPCCKVGSRYGCCPYSYGICCGDGTCVPNGGRC